MKKKQREFDDFEIDCSLSGVILTIYPVKINTRVKTSFDIQGVIVKFMKTKGWVYV